MIDYIERPKPVTKAESQVLDARNAQLNANQQFENIYDKLDELVKMENEIPEEIKTEEILFEGSASAPTLSKSIRDFKEIAVYYKSSREGKYLYGKKIIPIVEGNIYFSLVDTFCVANSTEIKGMCVTYIISDTKITVQHANQFAIIQASGSGINGNNSYVITKVIGIY